MTKKQGVVKKKPPRKCSPGAAPRLRHMVSVVTKLPGKKNEGGWEGRYKDAPADVVLSDDRVKFTVACQTVTVTKRDLIKLGVGLFEMEEALKKLPKLDGVNWTTTLALELPTVGGPNMKVVKEDRGSATWIIFEKINRHPYKFKCRAETFKELLGILSKQYRVEESK